MSHISKATADARRQVMIDRLTEAFDRAKAKACNANHGALIIERLMEEAGYRIAQKTRASASAGGQRGVVRSDPAAGEGLR